MGRSKTKYQENYGNENESYDETRKGSNFHFFLRTQKKRLILRTFNSLRIWIRIFQLD